MQRQTPSKSDIRLALELIELHNPNASNKAQLVKDIFNFDVSVEYIERVPSFKKVLYRKVIKGVKNVGNGKSQIIITRVKNR